MAAQGIAATGYGIRYEYGLFRQEVRDGWQQWKPDDWLERRSPWMIEPSGEAVLVPIYGRVDHAEDRAGDYNPMWMDWKLLVGVPFDQPLLVFRPRNRFT